MSMEINQPMMESVRATIHERLMSHAEFVCQYEWLMVRFPEITTENHIQEICNRIKGSTTWNFHVIRPEKRVVVRWPS